MAGYDFGIIGGGRMSEAIVRALIDSVICSRHTMVISDPDSNRRTSLSNDLRLVCVPDNRIPARCQCILLAVESRIMGQVLEEIAPFVSGDTLVISIAPDISTEFMDKALGMRGHIVRAIPNAPLLVRAGMTAVCAGPRATSSDIKHAQRIFSACGRTVIVDEKLAGAVESVSRCGPAYLFYLAEAMIQAGVTEGLDRETAKTLTEQACLGAAKMLSESTERPDILRMQTTRPGGPTQQAISSLDTDSVRESLVSAVRAAADKSRNIEE
ncbi:MAG: pyrroline-5-carboxylate reductase [bacterium]|nr:pyrroline-5-carboxylate reductase [bacterium]